MTRLKLNKLLN